MAPVAFHYAVDDLTLRAFAGLHVGVEVPELLDGGKWWIEVGGVGVVIVIVIVIVGFMAPKIGRTDGDIVVVEPVKHECEQGRPVQTVEML
jgi:hypothetical protein